MQLSVSPHSCLMDEEIVIHATGLQPHSDVTLLAQTSDRNTRFYSYASFTADHNGEVDLTKMAPHAGRYSEPMSMGLFCSLIQEPNQKPGRRLMKQDVTSPLEFSMTLLQGTKTDENVLLTKERNALATATCQRWYMGPGVERIPVKHNRIKATMFIPAGDGPFPGVLEMFGTVGGLVEHRAALLASRGFATIALNYFDPSVNLNVGEEFDINSMMKTDIEYYLEAADILLSHPKVLSQSFGVIGTSKGADLGLMISVCSVKVRACISVGGLMFNSFIPMTFKDRVFPSMDTTIWNSDKFVHKDGTVRPRDLFDEMKEQIKDLISEEIYVPIEQSQNAHYLVIHGEDDQCTPVELAQDVADRLRSHGKSNYQIVTYPGAGHLIEPPYAPHTWSSLHGMFNAIAIWGGEVHQHAAAQKDSWRRIQEFLYQRLVPQNKL